MLPENEMRFESRDLEPYAKPVNASEVGPGQVYFAVQFVDEQMLVPTVEPLVYIGRDLFPDAPDSLYFQDAESYFRGVRIDGARASEAVIYAQEESQLNHIFSYERALDVLLRCSLRRNKLRSD